MILPYNYLIDFVIIQEMNLRLSTSRGLTVRMDNENSAFQRELDLNLNPMSPFDTVTFNLVVLADFILTKDATAMEHKVFTFLSFLFFYLH